jgi:hypothetical protein
MKKERLCIQRDENWKSKLLKEDPYIYAKKISLGFVKLSV